MSVNKLSMARVAVGSLLVGSAPGKANRPLSPVEVSGIFTTTAAVTPGTIAASTGAQISVTIPGVRAGDVIIPVQPTNLDAGLVAGSATVTAANTVKVVVQNITAGSITATAKTWEFLWIQLYPNN